METQNVKCLSDGERYLAPADKLRRVIQEIRPELGYRRPHVRAALDLAQLMADDPSLGRSRVSGFNAFLLASDVLNKAGYRLPPAMMFHGQQTAQAASFKGKLHTSYGLE